MHHRTFEGQSTRRLNLVNSRTKIPQHHRHADLREDPYVPIMSYSSSRGILTRDRSNGQDHHPRGGVFRHHRYATFAHASIHLPSLHPGRSVLASYRIVIFGRWNTDRRGNRQCQVQDPGQGGHPPRPAAPDLRGQAARGRSHAQRLQHPEGVDIASRAPSAWRYH